MEMFKRTTYSNDFPFSNLHSSIFDIINFFNFFLKIVLNIVSGICDEIYCGDDI